MIMQEERLKCCSQEGQREWDLVDKRKIDLILKKKKRNSSFIYVQTEGAHGTHGSSFMIVLIFLMIEEAGFLATVLGERRCAVV